MIADRELVRIALVVGGELAGWRELVRDRSRGPRSACSSAVRLTSSYASRDRRIVNSFGADSDLAKDERGDEAELFADQER